MERRAVALLAFLLVNSSVAFVICPSVRSRKRLSTTTTMAMAAKRAVGKLRPEHTAFLLCDIQDKFRTLMYNGETIIKTASYMTSVAKLLDIPIVATEQYSKVFGPTVDECFADPEDRKSTPTFEKKIFSMLCGPEMDAHLETLNRSTYVLFGIETHVCVQQTALDLLEKGHEVHIIVDGVSSQQPIDRDIALQRLSQAGAWLTTAQSAAFMLMQSAEHKRFKKVSRLTVEHMKLHNEFNDAFKTAIKKEEMEAEA